MIARSHRSLRCVTVHQHRLQRCAPPQALAHRHSAPLRARSAFVLALSCAAVLSACGQQQAASDLQIERLPDVNPSLPTVPTLEAPPYEVTYSDGCFSVYGVRRRGGTTMDTDVCMTGYIVAIYQPPECPEGRTCDPPAAPHLWIADARDAGDEADERIMLAGYAENQAQINEAVEQARRGRYVPPDPESGILPIPVDFAVGAKVKIQGRFTRMSGMGFNVSNGLIDYRGHELVEPPPAAQ